jgi:ABC-type transport system involved in cytochrome bd biosynthesis fused ATPase/permease subunit
MGDKPILLLDEATSQLDPIAEAELYSEFAAMVENRTAVFITHRLGSTMITDRKMMCRNAPAPCQLLSHHIQTIMNALTTPPAANTGSIGSITFTWNSF